MALKIWRDANEWLKAMPTHGRDHSSRQSDVGEAEHRYDVAMARQTIDEDDKTLLNESEPPKVRAKPGGHYRLRKKDGDEVPYENNTGKSALDWDAWTTERRAATGPSSGPGSNSTITNSRSSDESFNAEEDGYE